MATTWTRFDEDGVNVAVPKVGVEGVKAAGLETELTESRVLGDSHNGRITNGKLIGEEKVYFSDLTIVVNRSYIKKYQIPLDLLRKIVTFLCKTCYFP